MSVASGQGTDLNRTGDTTESTARRPNLDEPMNPLLALAFVGALALGLLYTGYSVFHDVGEAGTAVKSYWPFLLLGLALFIALAFEFVNGFHDTANAVATVIYTNAMPAGIAVVWAGFFNFLGVLFASGAVAFGIISLLPVELVLQVGAGAGFAMVFALLIAAILWNLGTWYLGLPASSSHTLIGSIIGVGVANAMMHGLSGTSGVDWTKATEIGYSLLISPVVGFGAAALLFLSMKFVIRNPALYRAPEGNTPPPLWIRALLILTCTGVSFAHGSNDGQKGMGLIMLILIGTVPTAYALNRTMPDSQMAEFSANASSLLGMISERAAGPAVPVEEARAALSAFVAQHKVEPATLPALGAMAAHISDDVGRYGSLSKVPAEAAGNTRNDMYLASEAIRFILKDKANGLTAEDAAKLSAFKGSLDKATRFIPFWVKVSVAIALGLGTMVGWKRIVITVGEKIGKTHLTYGQGAAAEIVAAGTIGAADMLGLPVSTTHVLSSGVAGTMAANGSGLQWATVRNLLLAWVLTLPAAILLSGTLYVLFASLF